MPMSGAAIRHQLGDRPRKNAGPFRIKATPEFSAACQVFRRRLTAQEGLDFASGPARDFRGGPGRHRPALPLADLTAETRALRPLHDRPPTTPSRQPPGRCA
ncbi:hypothetical protein [Rhodovulum sulfidophilum]|uniref:hypothetical protein n=1 Tax=Rhodovulum sulfidophilum TaxID=35806 RepID=UPI001C4BE006|nr:hypothetical protein [Rhodovulum sulfidophilum]